MFKLISFLIYGIQPLLVPICFVVAWTVIILVVWSLCAAARDGLTTAKQMHQIPCTGCQFFTDNYRLKCTVRPSIANTEEAIDCSDYQPKTNPYLY
ncbi:hypothetical protein [Nostoc edaphicum]|uniref:Uncharacterized protein n=1 Tax=Nostoc edaphicum CCNP1411 TaxID=1472755 RepID=A0A7D7QEU1_9NOSO|nr:hypothetical protein [Nostoc edaphicum]QMS90679.1 hypothetical protein HUN01_24985 [Nostoc edaphicum CCNP1411]